MISAGSLNTEAASAADLSLQADAITDDLLSQVTVEAVLQQQAQQEEARQKRSVAAQQVQSAGSKDSGTTEADKVDLITDAVMQLLMEELTADLVPSVPAVYSEGSAGQPGMHEAKVMISGSGICFNSALRWNFAPPPSESCPCMSPSLSHSAYGITHMINVFT